jgi:hypothetical protein
VVLNKFDRRWLHFVHITQKEFNQEVLLTSLALCFKQSEQALSVEQIVVRGLTPDTHYSRSWINELMVADSIRWKSFNSSSIESDAKVKRDIVLERPGQQHIPLEQFVANRVLGLRLQLENDCDCGDYLQVLNLEVMGGECIQYANFYAARDNLIIIDSSPNDLNLRLLLQENMRDQVFMLLWRAIKNQPEISSNGTREVSFADLAQRAFEYYLSYKERGSTIEAYPWPKSLPMSKLASVVSLLKNI